MSPSPPGELTEEELERLRGRLRDSTLETLEFVASGGHVGRGVDTERLLRLAAREAVELRECLEGLLDPLAQTLEQRLARVVAHERLFVSSVVELDAGPMDGSLRRLATVELAAAVREALAGVRTAGLPADVVVRCEEREGAATITVDSAADSELDPAGWRSLVARMERLGGEAAVQTTPGSGMSLRLDYPHR